MMLLLVGCDQATKWRFAVPHLKNQARQAYFGDTLRLEYAENPGAFLSLLGGASPQVRFWVLTVGNGVVLSGFLAYLLLGRSIDRLTFMALALVVCGGAGNMVDRVLLDNRVIDFMSLGWGDLRCTGIFNVADMAITSGFLLLLPKVFASDPATLAEAPAETSGTTG